MARKIALVVDDSKTARVILSRMLGKYDIEVAMAESAEQAIEYLNHHRPNAIFMDHLMPGMNGLQAVKAIKSNPQTATIPILMYTSQESELYLGQARALGAIGVLPKQVRPVDVSKVLYELRLLPERRDRSKPVMLPVEVHGDPGAGRTVAVAPARAPVPETELARHLGATAHEQTADVSRFIVTNLDKFAARIVNDLRAAAPEIALLAAPRADPPRHRSVWPSALALTAACAIAAVGGMLWISNRDDAIKSRSEARALAAANAELRHSGDALAATVKVLTKALAGGASSLSANSASRIEPVPYGEIPFDRGRTDALREFLAKLEAQGFRGVVKATSIAGAFCLTGNPTDGFSPANAALPVSKCDLVGNPFEDSLSVQQRQSLAFFNLASGVRQRTGGAITVVVEPGGTRAVVPYPERGEAFTAGDWNRSAAANNRVEYSADSSGAEPRKPATSTID